MKDGVTGGVILDKVLGSRNAPILLSINIPSYTAPEEPPPPEQPDLGLDNTCDTGSSYTPYDTFNFVPQS